jgi:hypothetical protein
MSYVRHYHSDEMLYQYCTGPDHNVADEQVNWLYASGGVQLNTRSGNDSDCHPFNKNNATGLTGGFNGYAPAWVSAASADNFDFDDSYYWGPGGASVGNENNTVQTKVMILPPGEQAIGQSALYLVAAQVINEDAGVQLAASAVQFMHQLAGTSTEDVTNSDGSVWTEAVVSGAAGAPIEATPIVAGDISFTGMKISKLVYFYVDSSGEPGNFVASDVQKNLQLQLSTNVFDNLPDGSSVQIKVDDKNPAPKKLGWDSANQTYINWVNWNKLNVGMASSAGGETRIRPEGVEDYCISHGGEPTTQTWVNFFAHEGIWLNAGGHFDCLFDCVDGEISSGTANAFSKYTVLPSSRTWLRSSFGF